MNCRTRPLVAAGFAHERDRADGGGIASRPSTFFARLEPPTHSPRTPGAPLTVASCGRNSTSHPHHEAAKNS